MSSPGPSTANVVGRGRSLAIPALVAFLCWSAHAFYRVGLHDGVQLLWNCNVAILILGPSLALRLARPTAIAFSWLALGTPLWVLDVASGGEFLPTTMFTHLGGVWAGAVGLSVLGWPRGTWWRSLSSLVALQVICRLTTPAVENVNAAFSVHSIWPWPSWPYPAYYVTCLFLVGFFYFMLEKVVLFYFRESS